LGAHNRDGSVCVGESYYQLEFALGEQVYALPVHDPRSGPGAILEKMSGAALQLARNPMERQFFEERIGVRHAAAS
jgi:hypothetical protein